MQLMQKLVILTARRLKEARWGYNRTNHSNLIKVVEVGRLQIIFGYFGSCRCNFHLDRKYFYGFHHVTRYRFLVYHKKLADGRYEDIWFPLYIPFAKELRIITKTIKIDNDLEKKYPKKHFDNMIRTSPPTLYQQCVNRLMESTFCQIAKKDMKQGRLTSVYSNYRVFSMQHPLRIGRILWNFKQRSLTNGGYEYNHGSSRDFHFGRPPFFLSN